MSRNAFPFRVEPRFRFPLLLFGVTQGRAEVTVDQVDLHIRFGLLTIDTPLANISKVEVAGPYRWWRAIGVRLSLVDRGITFGTSNRSGVCIQLRDPVSVRIGRLTVPLHHPGITVTTEDPAGLAALLEPESRTA